jgi:phosphoserine phosphatase
VIRPTTVLATVTGRDRPGVTASFFAALAAHDVDVRDVQQVLVRERLILTVLIDVRGDITSLRNSVTRAAGALGMDCEITVADDGASARSRGSRCHVMILGTALRPGAIGHVAQGIADTGGNIETVTQLGTEPLSALELVVTVQDGVALRRTLVAAAREAGLDLAVEPAALRRRAKRLIVLDLDVTSVRDRVVTEIADRTGVLDQIRAITERAAVGEIAAADVPHAHAAVLAGTAAELLDAARAAVQLGDSTAGFVATLRRLGYQVGAVSTGIGVSGALCDIDLDFVASNELEVVDGRLSGALRGPVLDGPGKADALQRGADKIGVALAQTVAVGSGVDVEVLERAGLGIAVARPQTAASPHGELPYGDNVLLVLGLTPDEIAASGSAQ